MIIFLCLFTHTPVKYKLQIRNYSYDHRNMYNMFVNHFPFNLQILPTTV